MNFAPLEYIDVLDKKPLCISLPRYVYQTNLMTISRFVRFNREYKTILMYIDKLNDMQGVGRDIVLIANWKKLINIIVKQSGGNYNPLRRFFYYRYAKKYFYKNLDKFLDVTKLVLRYNTEVKKKAQELQNFDIWQGGTSATIGGTPLTDYVTRGENGKIIMRPRHL